MDLTEEQERMLREAAAENERKAEAAKKKDRTAQMGDVVRAMAKHGFAGDTKVRWRLDPDPDKARETAADLLMRGLAYVIGRRTQWLPEYDNVAAWLADNRGKGLLCVGSCGRGKTVITRDILPVLFENTINIRFPDGKVGHPFYNYFKATELKARWGEIARCKIVCVDDIGTESQVEYGRREDWFGKLVDLCNDRDKLLIGSTNLTMHQLFGGTDDEPDDPHNPDGPTHPVTYPARYDERTYSRLLGNTVRVYFEGEDLRIKQ